MFLKDLNKVFDKSCTIDTNLSKVDHLADQMYTLTLDEQVYITIFVCTNKLCKTNRYDPDKIYVNITSFYSDKNSVFMGSYNSYKNYDFDKTLIKGEHIFALNEFISIKVILLTNRISIDQKNCQWFSFFDFYNPNRSSTQNKSVFGYIIEQTTTIPNTHLNREMKLRTEKGFVGSIKYKELYEKLLLLT